MCTGVCIGRERKKREGEIQRENRSMHDKAHMWRSEDNLRCWTLASILFEGSHHSWARQTHWLRSFLGFSCLLLPFTTGKLNCRHALSSSFTWALGIWIYVLMLSIKCFTHWDISPALIPLMWIYHIVTLMFPVCVGGLPLFPLLAWLFCLFVLVFLSCSSILKN